MYLDGPLSAYCLGIQRTSMRYGPRPSSAAQSAVPGSPLGIPLPRSTRSTRERALGIFGRKACGLRPGATDPEGERSPSGSSVRHERERAAQGRAERSNRHAVRVCVNCASRSQSSPQMYRKVKRRPFFPRNLADKPELRSTARDATRRSPIDVPPLARYKASGSDTRGRGQLRRAPRYYQPANDP